MPCRRHLRLTQPCKSVAGMKAHLLVVAHLESNNDGSKSDVQDYKDGSYSQVTASTMDNKWREDFERMKKARVHRCVDTPSREAVGTMARPLPMLACS